MAAASGGLAGRAMDSWQVSERSSRTIELEAERSGECR